MAKPKNTAADDKAPKAPVAGNTNTASESAPEGAGKTPEAATAASGAAPSAAATTTESATAASQEAPAAIMPAPNGATPTRAYLDAALQELPDDYTDADFVVNQMRAYFGGVFTADDEAHVRKLVKAPPKNGHTHRVNWTLWMSRKRYGEGDTLTLTDEDAAKLGDVVTKL